MELTVFCQKSKTRPSGVVAYKGEDARPYVDDKLLLVADGLGGAAAILHQMMDSRIFDVDQILDVLFRGVYADYADEAFVQYVKDSFFELFAVKDCYTDDSLNNVKKSGYFGSRIVAAVVLHEMLYNWAEIWEAAFQEIAQASAEQNDKKIKELCEALADYFTKKVQEEVRKIAAQANFFNETGLRGMALLGSTLCATIYIERENSVDAIVLTAGDSLPYMWNAWTGLHVLDDQRTASGGMVSCIKANDDADFQIRCQYYSFDKPCVLFNASDGCYDAGVFGCSALAFEQMILQKAVESGDADEMSAAIHEFFVTNGRHDDSSTLAMKMFGYDSFEAFKKSAAERLETIEAEYTAKMPDLLTHNYVAEYKQVELERPRKLGGLKLKYEADPAALAVRDYCTEQIRTGRYAPYNKQTADVAKEKESVEQRRAQIIKRIEEIVKRNFSRFYSLLEHDETRREHRALGKIQKTDARHERQSEDYLGLIERYRSEFEKTKAQMQELLERIFEIGIPIDYSAYDEISVSVVQDCEKSMDDLVAFFKGLCKGKQKEISNLARLRREYIEQNQKLAEDNPEAVRQIVDLIVRGGIDDPESTQARILIDDYEKLMQTLTELMETNREIERLETEKPREILHACRVSFWRENYAVVVEALLSVPDPRISDALRAETQAIVDDFLRRTESLRGNADQQRELLGQYDREYLRYLAD